MTASPIDRELLDAFMPEFAAGLARLERATDTAAALRVLGMLRPMVSALGLTALEPGLDSVAAAIEPHDPALLGQVVAGLRRDLAMLGPVGQEAAAPVTTMPVRTLVVDDSPTMRRLVRGILGEDAAFEVVAEAANGLEALECLRALSPALILLDLEMPVLDGFGFLHRWMLAGGGAVVVVSSAAPPGSEAARALRRLGVSAVVGKPSGALSFDLAEKRGAAVLDAARRAMGLVG